MTQQSPAQTTSGRPSGRQTATRYVRHFLADFAALEREYPDGYPKMIVKGEGAYVVDDEGRRLLDAGSHLGACQVGHGRREIGERIARQISELEFIALDAGISHIYVAELGERLAGLVECDEPVLSFTNSGSESNELAFKIARTYHSRRGEPGRTKIISRFGSYHGSTIAASAATGMASFKTGFGPLASDFLQSTQPSPGRCGHCGAGEACTLQCIDDMAALIEREGAGTIAAVIAEPVAIPQAVKVPHPDYFPRLRKLCDDNGILLIIDEVVCGFGRTGRMFGSQHFGVRGDIVSYAKGLTSGYIPMGAVAVSGRVNEVFAKSPLLHLNTYAGHPVACVAAMAALDILEEEKLTENAAAMEGVLRDELMRMSQAVPRVREVSVIGLLSSVVSDISDKEDPDATLRRARKLAYDEGLLVRFGRDGNQLSAHFYPPLLVNRRDIEDGVRALEAALRAL
jgi:adenosylmethionine-8-amino-7-oxononanoate aminotransferase